jgi:TonB family protein
LAFVSIAILLSSQSYSRLGNKFPTSFQDQPGWGAFAPEGEELTVMVPSWPPWPTVRNYPVSSADNSDSERILAHRQFSGYGNGLVFIIDSYKAKRPQRIEGDLQKFADNGAAFEREITFDGITARQYRSTYEGRSATYTRRFVLFATKEHVYRVTLATLEDPNPVVDRFLSSLRLRRPDDRTTSDTQRLDSIPGPVLSPTEVTRRAIIVSKGEPFYTERARAHKIVGTVKLEAVLGADGYVTRINVIQGLQDGLTENAIEAARSIRFFPAEKDGKPISQHIQLEYNFSVY